MERVADSGSGAHPFSKGAVPCSVSCCFMTRPALDTCVLKERWLGSGSVKKAGVCVHREGN